MFLVLMGSSYWELFLVVYDDDDGNGMYYVDCNKGLFKCLFSTFRLVCSDCCNSYVGSLSHS